MKVSYLLLLLSVTLAVSVLAVVPTASGGVTIVSPTMGQHFSAGQNLVLVVNAPGYVGQTVTVYVYNPGGSEVYTNVFQVPSSGVLNVTLFTWPSTTSSSYTPGNYTIVVLVGSSASASVTVYWAPGIAYIVAHVVNGETGAPLASVPVNVYNASNGALLGSGITNANGVANISIVALPNHVETVKVVAMPSGYPAQGVTTTVTGPGVYSVTIKVYPTAVQLEAVEVIQSGKVTAESPQSITVVEGIPVTLVVAVNYQGSPASGATVTANVTYGNVTTQVTGTPIGNGEYNITFTVPSGSTPLGGQVSVIATYNGIKSNTLTLSLSAIPNTQSMQNELNTLNSTVITLSKTVGQLNTSLTKVQTQLANVTSQLSSVSSQMSSLSSQISSLQSKMNTLSSQMSQLQSQLASSSNMVYAALGISIVALIIAIVALVYVLRKIS